MTYSKNPTAVLAMFEAPEIVTPKAFVQISFLRPDGDGVFRAVYNMSSDLDLAIVNGNIADGYRIVAMSYRGTSYTDPVE